MAAPLVDADLVHHEMAHTIHINRHRGDNYFCASDALLAAKVLDMYAERAWIVMQIPLAKAKLDA